MATKGASNHYGNARGGRQGHITKHTGFAWAKGFNKSTLTDHADRHGRGYSKEEYLARAVAFANRVDRVNNISYVRKDGTTVKYNKKTNEFVIVTKKGIATTYYHPKKGIQEYYKDRRNINENIKLL
jgi:pyocin large subunit-like protein